jgi:hypothetical protein
LGSILRQANLINISEQVFIRIILLVLAYFPCFEKKLKEAYGITFMHVCVSFYVCPSVYIHPNFWGVIREFLATDPEVPGSIPGATRFSEK